jgi:hypothetical protein
MSRQARSTPFPSGMQGRWLDTEEPSAELIVAGGEVTCFGRLIDYDCKEVEEVDGALTVSLLVNDEARIDTFDRENITGLVLAPDGEFHAYNVKFAAHFVRA